MKAHTDFGRLSEVLENKKREVEELKRNYSPPTRDSSPARPSFGAALRQPYLTVIAEVKRSSPSAGDINRSHDPLDIARIYAANGADVVSVLCDQKYFGGGIEFLQEIAGEIHLPLLCKEFIIDPIQIEQARAAGASAVLLITDILDDTELETLHRKAGTEGLQVLTEAHHPDNIRRAVELGAEIIGINNRNLFTFETDIRHSVRHINLIPPERIRLSLSAVDRREQAVMLRQAGFDGILVGTSLMKSDNPGVLLQQLKGIK